MTYGYWLTLARVHLGDAAEELAETRPSDLTDVLAAATSRGDVLRQLARHAEMLIQPTSPNRATGRRDLYRASLLATFRQRLRSAADDIPVRLPVAPESAAKGALAAAADCLSVGADILASHLAPYPRTPEGVAIRAGGGVVSAAAELARVAFDAIAVDMALTEWLDVPDAALRAIGEPLVAATRRTTAGTLPSVLGEVLTLIPPGPPLLHSLAAAPAIGLADAEANTMAEAAASLRTALIWLWQRPDQVRTIHLRLGAQLGLAATILNGADDPSRASAATGWRPAARCAADIEGSVAADDALAAADRLRDALHWTRAALENDAQARIDGIVAQLPSLAETLLKGATSAVQRGDVFINRTALTRAPTGVVRIKSVWRRATSSDPEIVGLRDALNGICRAQSPTGRSAARNAFQRPAQPGSPTPQPSPSPTMAPNGPRRSSTR